MNINPLLQNIKYVLVGCFIAAVAFSTIFLVYVYVVQRDGTPQAGGEKTESQPSRPSGAVIVQRPDTTGARFQFPVVTRQPEKTTATTYTVYISAYPIRPPADDEAQRWEEANYNASVVDQNRFFSVGLGRYATVSEAREFAKQMSEAFENGYFIGKIK